MKVAIYTQYMENYGTAEKPYWKFKGGSTFVIEGLTDEQADRAVKTGCPTICSLIEYDNPGAREYVCGVVPMADDKAIGEPWETVTKLVYVGGRWIATEVEENGEYGYMRREILRKRAAWVMLPGGERGEYKCEYELRDGKIVAADKLGDALGV